MIDSELMLELSKLKETSGVNNYFCNLRSRIRYIEDGNILKKISENETIKNDIYTNYLPKSIDTLFKRSMFYDKRDNNSINDLLSWGSELLVYFFENANKFYFFKCKYEHALFSENYEKAMEILNSIEKQVCYSIWGLHQKLLVYNLANKQMETYEIEKIQRAIINPGYATLLLSYYSRMADNAIDFDEYNVAITQLLDSVDNNQISWRYFDHKLNLIDEKNIQGIKSALIFDEQLSFIDYYETYIDSLQLLSDKDRHISTIKNIVNKLSKKNCDFRIKNLNMAINRIEGNFTLDDTICNLIENYTCGKYEYIKEGATETFNNYSDNFEVCKLLVKTGIVIEDLNIPLKAFWKDLRQIYSFNYDAKNSITRLGNYYKFYYGTSWRYKIFNIMVRKLHLNHELNVLFYAVINDKSYTPLFYQCIKSSENKLKYISRFQEKSPATAILQIYMLTGEIHNNSINVIDPIRWLYYEIQQLILNKKFSLAIEKCCQYLFAYGNNKNMLYYEERIRRILYNCYLTVKSYEEAMNLYVESYLITEELVLHMELHNLIIFIDDEDENIKANICKPIVYSLYFRSSNDEVRSVYLDYLESKDSRTIKVLLEKYKQLREVDILFLNKVCTQSLLMKDYVSKTEVGGSAAELRAEVLRVLINFDLRTERVKEYINELNSIYKVTQLQKIINSFNHNRIFIDTDNLYLYMKDDLEREFAKYKAVQELRKTLHDTISNKKEKSFELENLFVYEQYWDQHKFFNGIIEKIKVAYLNTSPYSLECFIGTRIRHNYCKDNLKKVFEEENLFSKKMKDNSPDYIVNDYWKDRLPEEDYNIVIVVLSRFSQIIDTKINEIREKWMRIKQDDVGFGLFDFRFVTQYFLDYVFYDYEKALNDSEGFFKEIIIYLDEYTGILLNKIKEKIDSDLKPYYNRAISELETNIKAIDFDKYMKSEMLRKIEISKAKYIDDIEGFKDIFNMEHDKYPDYTLTELIEFCLEIEKDMNNQFRYANVTTNINDNFLYDGNVFPYLVDIMGILIRNAIEHSQFTNMEKMQIEIDINPYSYIKENYKYAIQERKNEHKFSDENNIVVLKVANNLNINVNEKTVLQKVKEKVDDIYSGKYMERSRQEGGSGLYKIARSVQYSLHSHVDYYWDLRDGIFEINIVIDLGKYRCKEQSI
jgi:hypothetical protein